MNKILIIFLVFIFFGNTSCQSTGENTNNPNNKNTAVANTQVIAAKDTIKPKPKPTIIYEKARSSAKIKKTFPFDIDLKKADGTIVNSSEVLKSDKPTILLFWLTTCMPCRAEMNAIQKVYDQYNKDGDFNLIAISTDFEKNYGAFVQRVKESNWPWKSYNDVNREFRLVMPGGLNGLPQSFIFDKNGNIVFHKRKFHFGDEIKLLSKAKELAVK